MFDFPDLLQSKPVSTCLVPGQIHYWIFQFRSRRNSTRTSHAPPAPWNLNMIPVFVLALNQNPNLTLIQIWIQPRSLVSDCTGSHLSSFALIFRFEWNKYLKLKIKIITKLARFFLVWKPNLKFHILMPIHTFTQNRAHVRLKGSWIFAKFLRTSNFLIKCETKNCVWLLVSVWTFHKISNENTIENIVLIIRYLFLRTIMLVLYQI